MKKTLGYVAAFAKWLALGCAIGAICGAVGSIFSISVTHSTKLRIENEWLLYLLPFGGLAIAGLYRVSKLPLNIGTDKIIESVRTQESVPFLMAPLIFVSTAITHLLGGSAGREGAALQLGGSIAVSLGRAAKLRREDMRIIELCGMAALFSALFGTPFTAAVFVLEVVDVGRLDYRALMPCVISSVTAIEIAQLFGLSPEAFSLPVGLSIGYFDLLKTMVLGAVCAVCAILFCRVMHFTGTQFKKLIKNDFLRILLGGCAVVAITLLLGTRDYNGAGMNIVAQTMQGKAKPAAFALKMLLTAITLSSGYKGGEIVPSFFIGATLGCVVGGLLGLDPALAAAIGLVSVFCGVTNTPAASIILSVEMFGCAYLMPFGLSIAISFMLSGHCSLYHSQHFLQRKLGARENEKSEA